MIFPCLSYLCTAQLPANNCRQAIQKGVDQKVAKARPGAMHPVSDIACCCSNGRLTIDTPERLWVSTCNRFPGNGDRFGPSSVQASHSQSSNCRNGKVVAIFPALNGTACRFAVFIMYNTPRPPHATLLSTPDVSRDAVPAAFRRRGRLRVQGNV